MNDSLLTRGSAEYKAALEIELWKDITQQEFLVSLQKKENNLLEECCNTFKLEHSKQESEIRTTKKVYHQAVRQYKEKLSSLEKREKKFSQNNKAFKQTNGKFEHDRCIMLDDIKQKASFRSDFLNLELEAVTQKIENAHTVSKKISQRLVDLDKSVITKEEEISSISTKLASPMFYAIDQDVLMSAKIEFSNMKDYLSKLTAAKERYKLKLLSVLDEISNTQQNPVSKNHNYMPTDKMRCNVLNERSKVSNEKENKSSLENLKTEVDKIIATMSEKPSLNYEMPLSNIESDIAKLISERNTLLNTGVYLSNDFIIQQIDDKIQDLLKVKEKS